MPLLVKDIIALPVTVTRFQKATCIPTRYSL